MKDIQEIAELLHIICISYFQTGIIIVILVNTILTEKNGFFKFVNLLWHKRNENMFL